MKSIFLQNGEFCFCIGKSWTFGNGKSILKKRNVSFKCVDVSEVEAKETVGKALA